MQECGDKTMLVQRVKEIQRSSAESKKSWYTWCSMQGTSDYDPARHDERFLRRFCESLQQEGGSLKGTPLAAARAGGKTTGSPTAAEWTGSESSSSQRSVAASAEGWQPVGSSQEGRSLSSSWHSSNPSWAAGDAWRGTDHAPAQHGSSSAAMEVQMVKGKGPIIKDMVMAATGWIGKGAAVGKGGGCLAAGSKGTDGAPSSASSVVAAAGSWWRPGPDSEGMHHGLRGTEVLGKAAAAATWFATTGSGRGKSEFGILDVAPPQALLNQKRGIMMTEEGACALMDEAQAKEFQQALKRRR